MSWDESVYVINSIRKKIRDDQISGIPPKNMRDFSVVSENNAVRVKCSPPLDTTVGGQLICTVGGVVILKKEGSKPNESDPGIVLAEVEAGSSLNVLDRLVTTGKTYYYAFYPYSDHGVYNTSNENVLSISI